jgi:hypothetical protein
VTEPEADFQPFTIRLSKQWQDVQDPNIQIKHHDSDRTVTVTGTNQQEIKIAKTAGLPFSPSTAPTQ